jgi:hypothetical protein
MRQLLYRISGNKFSSLRYNYFLKIRTDGKNSLQKAIGRDTTAFFELRPNLNVFQQGKFTNTFTAGIGYILNAQENLLTELSSRIEYAYSPQIHFNFF